MENCCKVRNLNEHNVVNKYPHYNGKNDLKSEDSIIVSFGAYASFVEHLNKSGLTVVSKNPLQEYNAYVVEISSNTKGEDNE